MYSQRYIHQRAVVETIKAIASSTDHCRLATSTQNTTPVKILNVDDEGMLWFFNLPGGCIDQDEIVKIIYDDLEDTYLTIQGHADVFDGNQLIRVHPDHVIYWDSITHKMVPLSCNIA